MALFSKVRLNHYTKLNHYTQLNHYTNPAAMSSERVFVGV